MADDMFFTNLLDTGEFRISETGNVQIMNEYIFLVPSPAIAKLYGLMEERCGQSEAAAMMREMGRFQVQQAAERYVDQYNFDEMGQQKIQDFTSKVIKLNGFGDVTFTDFERSEEKATVELQSSVFASRYHQVNGESDAPVDHWLAGLLEKHFSVVFNMDADVTEEECVAMGDDRCLFSIRG